MTASFFLHFHNVNDRAELDPEVIKNSMLNSGEHKRSSKCGCGREWRGILGQDEWDGMGTKENERSLHKVAIMFYFFLLDDK